MVHIVLLHDGMHRQAWSAQVSSILPLGQPGTLHCCKHMYVASGLPCIADVIAIDKQPVTVKTIPN